MDQGRADVVDRSHIHRGRRFQLGDAPQLNTAFEHLAKHVVGVRNTGAGMPGNPSGPVDRNRESASNSQRHNFLGHPLGLRVPFKQPLPSVEGIRLAKHVPRRIGELAEYGKCGNKMNWLQSCPARQPQHLPGSTDVGRFERCVGVDRTDPGAVVEDGINSGSESLKILRRETQSGFGQVPWDGDNS